MNSFITQLVQTSFETIPLFRRGKVRDVYDLGDALLFIATDRLSAFDVVMNEPIPFKGAVLSGLSAFWFEKTTATCANHLLTTNVDEYPDLCIPYRKQLYGRSMVVIKTIPVPIECVVRGYLSGSGWKEYKQTQSVCEIPLPAGLSESSRLPEPIFTPATKAETGHDENISFQKAVDIIGRDAAETVREMSLSIYSFAREYALERGIIIADTKFEFGVLDNEIILIDEVLTPDSSRFWPLDSYVPGSVQPSFDKQFVRDYLESIAWNKQPPPPPIPPDVIARTTEKYISAYERLTGKIFSGE